VIKRNYIEEARLLIQAILQEKASVYKLVDDATEKHFRENYHKIDALKLEGLEPAEQFSPFQELMRESEKLKQKFGKELFTLIVEANYNTRDEISLPEYQWTNHTKQIYESLIKTVAELLEQNKLKPLSK